MSTGPPAGPRSVKLCSDQKIFQFLFRTMPLLNPFSKKKSILLWPICINNPYRWSFYTKKCIKIECKIRKFNLRDSAIIGPFRVNISLKLLEIEEIRQHTLKVFGTINSMKKHQQWMKNKNSIYLTNMRNFRIWASFSDLIK